MTDRQLGAIDKVDSGFLATLTMEQGVKGQQESRHQGHKPAGAGEMGKAVAQLLLQAVAPEMLEVLIGGEREGHQDEGHLAEGELAGSLALTV